MNDIVKNEFTYSADSFKCQICYELFQIKHQFNLYCCKAIICNDCIECLNDCRCPFCRTIIESIKDDNKFYSSSAPVRSSFSNVILFSTNEPYQVQRIREDRRINIELKKKYNRSISNSPSKEKRKSLHEKGRVELWQKIKEEINEYYSNYTDDDIELE